MVRIDVVRAFGGRSDLFSGGTHASAPLVGQTMISEYHPDKRMLFQNMH